MTGAALKLSERALAATEAARRIHDARDSVREFVELSELDPQAFFARTVQEHRETIEAINCLLLKLCYGGRHIETIATEAGFGAQALEAIRAADMNLRVVRALVSVLIGDHSAFEREGAEVQAEVTRAIQLRASKNGEWTREEREAFGQRPRPFSKEFEARLIGS